MSECLPMAARRKSIRQKMSGIKNRIITSDLQDIYRYNSLAEAGFNRTNENNETSYQLHDDLQVLDLIERINPMSADQRSFALNRLSAGDKVIIGLADGEPVFYGWLMFEEIEVTYGVFMPTSRGIVFGYNLFTHHTHRRKGAMSGFYNFVANLLRQKNYHTLYVGIDRKNHVSIKAHKNNGFEKTGYFYTLKIFGRCLTLARFRHAKRFHFCNPQSSM